MVSNHFTNPNQLLPINPNQLLHQARTAMAAIIINGCYHHLLCRARPMHAQYPAAWQLLGGEVLLLILVLHHGAVHLPWRSPHVVGSAALIQQHSVALHAPDQLRAPQPCGCAALVPLSDRPASRPCCGRGAPGP